MKEEKKVEALHIETQEAAPDLETKPAELEPEVEPEPVQPPPSNGLAQKRGRMIAAGMLTAVILAVIAVVVAGIFQLTSGWLKVCPKDLPVNDPAKVLSSELTMEKAEPRPRGVSGIIADMTRLKGVEPAHVESRAETETGK